MKKVDLIASGYEWKCPACENMNNEIDVKEKVTCEYCGRTFKTGEINHALR